MFLLATESGALGIGVVFWILFIVGIVFFGYRNRANGSVILDSLFWWVLIFLLGCGVFGFPVRF